MWTPWTVSIESNGCWIQEGLFPYNHLDFWTGNLGHRDVLSEGHLDGVL